MTGGTGLPATVRRAVQGAAMEPVRNDGWNIEGVIGDPDQWLRLQWSPSGMTGGTGGIGSTFIAKVAAAMEPVRNDGWNRPDDRPVGADRVLQWSPSGMTGGTPRSRYDHHRPDRCNGARQE